MLCNCKATQKQSTHERTSVYLVKKETYANKKKEETNGHANRRFESTDQECNITWKEAPRDRALERLVQMY